MSAATNQIATGSNALADTLDRIGPDGSALPTVVLAMSDETAERVFPAPAIARLEAVAQLADSKVLTEFESERAEQLLRQAEVLLTAWGSPGIDAAVLARAPRLRAIVHAGGSVKSHLDPVCWTRGIAISSAVDANAKPVADYAAAMIMLAAKRVLPTAALYRERRAWVDPEQEFPRIGAFGTPVGLVGASRIGRLVAARLRDTDLRLLLADPFLSRAEAVDLGVDLVDLDSLITVSDVVSLHAPLLAGTRHLLDAGRIGALRPGATLINTARGGLVDTEALTARVSAGDLQVVLDVTDPDTLPPESPLWTHPSVVLTPHMAGSMGNELQRLSQTAIDEIARLGAGLPLLHPVSLTELEHRA